MTQQTAPGQTQHVVETDALTAVLRDDLMAAARLVNTMRPGERRDLVSACRLLAAIADQ